MEKYSHKTAYPRSTQNVNVPESWRLTEVQFPQLSQFCSFFGEGSLNFCSFAWWTSLRGIDFWKHWHNQLNGDLWLHYSSTTQELQTRLFKLGLLCYRLGLIWTNIKSGSCCTLNFQVKARIAMIAQPMTMFLKVERNDQSAGTEARAHRCLCYCFLIWSSGDRDEENVRAS